MLKKFAGLMDLRTSVTFTSCLKFMQNQSKWIQHYFYRKYQMLTHPKQRKTSLDDTDNMAEHQQGQNHLNLSHNKSGNNTKVIYTLFIFVVFLTILVCIFFYRYQQQETQTQTKLKQALLNQDQMIKSIQALSGQLKGQKLLTVNQVDSLQINKMKSYQNKNQQKTNNQKLPQNILGIRNFKEITSQDFSILYCLKQPLIPNNIPSKEPREFLINTRYGFQMYVDGGNGQIQYLSRTIMQQGTFEPEGINLLGRLLRPGYIVLNVGSQSGMEAIISAKIIGPKGHIYIFQPSNFSNYLVNKNFKHNNLTGRADIYKLAASDVKRTATLYIDKTNTGGNSLVNLKGMKSKNGLTQEVQVELVDNIIPSNVLIDLALIDVEFHEVQVLYGMRQLIKRSPYLVILVEWSYLYNKQRNQDKTMEVIKFFVQRRYSFYYSTGFNPNTCVVGEYRKVINPTKELLQIKYANLIISPNTVILP